jgi:iron complex outermembrane receptor protein
MTPAEADRGNGCIKGVLKDQKGAVVQAGTMGIKNLDTGQSRTTLTDQEGRYSFDSLAAGRYEISAASTGFEISVRGGISLSADEEAVIDMVLNVAKTETVVVVTATATRIGSEAVVPGRVKTNDAASLLDGVPGVSLYGSGGVSSLPAIHGMADDRVHVLVNGMTIDSACSNHMNPPLSYLAPANVGRVTVMAGITPVSMGGDSIGGSIAADTPPPEFAEPGRGVLTHGSFSAFHRSNGVVSGGNASASVATESFRVSYTGSYIHANDYTNGAGVMVKSTFYDSMDHALQLAVRRGDSVTLIDLGVQKIPQQAFVNARMDMTSNRASFANLHYDNVFGWGRFEARAYYEHTTHEMNILRDKIPGMNMPMDAKGTNLGYSINAEIPLSPRDTLRVGNEFRRFLLNDWWPPVSATVGSMGPDTLWNVRNGTRDRIGTYIEWETRRGKGWTALLGVRSDIVRMNTDSIAGYNMSTTATGSAAYYADATEFNSRDHNRIDINFDMTALAVYEPVSSWSYEVGYARKTRSPSLYERYLWVKRSNMSVHMNGWFGDANGYTGNLDLQPEVAHTLSATAGWHDPAKKEWELKVTPYFTRVQDFVDVNRCPVIANSNGCTAANLVAATGFVNLQFANHEARLYGVDGSGHLPLVSSGRLGSFVLSGVLGYVRGKNLDNGGNLYHMMPFNARLTLEHRRGPWSGAVDLQAVDSKQDVQAVRNELSTAGYALVNFRASYQWHLPGFDQGHLRLDAGIDNLANRNYVLPLGGRYWVGDKTGSSSVPGMGRTFYGGLTLNF